MSGFVLGVLDEVGGVVVTSEGDVEGGHQFGGLDGSLLIFGGAEASDLVAGEEGEVLHVVGQLVDGEGDCASTDG